ncbi:MAG TPA: PLDc N-terminal domain-containing protein [Geminicoccaceae bacterium]
MEPILFIAGLTALHLAVVALIDVLASSRPWRRKLGWGLVLLVLPLAGPVLYYRRGERRPERAPPRRAPTMGNDRPVRRTRSSRG